MVQFLVTVENISASELQSCFWLSIPSPSKNSVTRNVYSLSLPPATLAGLHVFGPAYSKFQRYAAILTHSLCLFVLVSANVHEFLLAN